MVSLRKTGWIPDSFDGRDRPYVYKGPQNWLVDFENALASMKYKVFLDYDQKEAKWLENIYDQSASGSCTANAVAAAVRFLAKKTNGPDHAKDPSRLFIYYNARALSVMELNGETTHWPNQLLSADKRSDYRDFSAEGGGSAVRNAFKSINIWGVASEAIWPFKIENETIDHKTGVSKPYILRINDRPTDAAYHEAKVLTALEYCRLDPPRTNAEKLTMGPLAKNADGIITLARLKQCLIEGYPVVFGFSFYHTWKEGPFNPAVTKTRKCDCCHCSKCQACEGTIIEWEKYPSLKEFPAARLHKGPPTGEEYGAHAVLAIGFQDFASATPYDTADAALGGLKGRVLVQNSWGKSDYPYFWIPYAYIIDSEATRDFWMLRELTPTKPHRDVVMAEGWRPTIVPHSRHENGLRKTGAYIAAVSRDKNLVEVFWISPDGRIQGAWYDSSNAAKPIVKKFSLFDTGTAGSGSIAAVSRHAKSIDVFFIDPQGAIRRAEYAESDTSIDYERRWKIKANVTSKNDVVDLASPITAVSRTVVSRTDVSRKTNLVDIWWRATDGSIRGASMDTSKKRVETGVLTDNSKKRLEWTSYSLSEPIQAANSNENLNPLSLKAISADSHHMAVFASYSDGTVKARVFNGINKWDVAPVDVTCNPNEASSMTGLATAPGEVFFVMPDGTVPHFKFAGPDNAICSPGQENGPVQNGDQVPSWTRDGIVAPHNSARVDSGIAALAMDGGATDVFWVGASNSLGKASLRGAGAEPNGDIAPPGTAAGGTPLVALKHGDTVSIVFNTPDAGIVIGSREPQAKAEEVHAVLQDSDVDYTDDDDTDEHHANGTGMAG